MIRSKKFSAAILTIAASSLLFVGSAAPASASPVGNRVIVSGYNWQNVEQRCLEKMRQYVTPRTRITQPCIYIGQTQFLEYGYAFWWTTSVFGPEARAS